MKTLLSTIALSFAGATSVLAQGKPPAPVPEISALEGTAAIAAVLAIVLLAWERRRRAT
ncbi:VPEID-CTERM sorting domain-containing protein [Marinovum sp.]|uniref:VPEID-CTERM sorting domain-containing protein n=1 Tax=Marinovum sp. TaxID=2024839 RepID=UPI003A8FAE72